MNETLSDMEYFKRSVTKADYQQYTIEFLKKYSSGKHGPMEHDYWVPISEAYFYKQTGDASLLAFTENYYKKDLKLFISEGKHDDHQFKRPMIWARAADALIQAGKLSDEEICDTKIFLSYVLENSEYERGSMNRAVGFMTSYRPIMKIIGCHRLESKIQALENLILKDFLEYNEPHENAYGYDGLTGIYLLDWLEQMDREDLYQSERFKAMFERMLQRISPTGITPSFGDWNSYEYTLGFYVAIFEKAASIYRDGRFKWAAHRLFNCYRLLMENSYETLGNDCYGFAFAHQWADDSVVPIQPCSGSVITKRNDGQLDKLVLRSNWGLNGLYGMFSLMNGNEHGHNDTLALNGIIYKDKIVLNDSGRNMRARCFHNTVQFRDDERDFPFYEEWNPYDQWQFARFKLNAHWIWGHFKEDYSMPVPKTHEVFDDIDDHFNYDPEKQFSFILSLSGTDRFKFILDRVELVGKKDTLVLDDFSEDVEGWSGKVSRISEGRQDTYGACFDIDFSDSDKLNLDSIKTNVPNRLIEIGKVYDRTLDIMNSDYEAIEFWYKFKDGIQPQDRGIFFGCVGEREGYPRKFIFHNSPMYDAKVNCFEDHDSFTYSEIYLKERDNYGRWQTHTREVFLLKNTFIWVRDKIEIPKDVNGTVGPVWHVKEICDHEESHWYDTKEQGHLLIYQIPRDQMDHGYLECEMQAKDTDYVIYQKCKTEGEESRYFDTVLIPHEEDEKASKIVDDIHIAYQDDKAIALEYRNRFLVFNPEQVNIQVSDLSTDKRLAYFERGDDAIMEIFSLK